MATRKQKAAARQNVRKAATTARKKQTLANLPSSTKSALGKQGAVAQRKRTGANMPKTRKELHDEARRRGLKGCSKMGREELARALGHI